MFESGATTHDRPVSGAGLQIAGLAVDRSATPVLRDVSLVAAPGEVTVLLGPNGAGKSTLLEAAAGLLPVRAGSVALAGQDLATLGPRRRTAMGLGYVAQGRAIFPQLTVTENLLVAKSRSHIDQGFELFPELRRRAHAKAQLLSGGEQQMLVLARTLLLKPTFLVLDEMSLGLAPTIVRRLLDAVRDLAATGIGVLLVEQYAKLACTVGSRAYVLAGGSIVADVSCAQVLDDPQLIRDAYFGHH